MTDRRETSKAERHQFGLTAATALIVGSIIGVGIFNLPTSLAVYGPISLVSMVLTTVGALALAVLFAALSRRMPADGGPYTYARAAFGDGVGFANAWSYWITAWAGNAAIAVGWVLHVEHFVNTGHSGEATIVAIGGGMAIALFSYLGVETAAVAAGRVRDPGRNVPRATILGTIATAVVYLLSLTAVFGILPTSQLSAATARSRMPPTPCSVAPARAMSWP